jgi:hypothetical protein
MPSVQPPAIERIMAPPENKLSQLTPVGGLREAYIRTYLQRIQSLRQESQCSASLEAGSDAISEHFGIATDRGLSTNACYPALSNRKSLLGGLPKSLLPFPTSSNIRQDTKSLGASAPRNAAEQWLSTQLASVYSANKALFADLPLDAIRITYDDSSDRLASVDTEGLEIILGPKALDLTGDSQALMAIVCHELSHILLGHQSFSDEPPAWVQAHPLYQAVRSHEANLYRDIDVHAVSGRYAAMTRCERCLREQMLALHEAVPSSGQSALAAIKAFAKNHPSREAATYRSLLEDEAQYQQQIERWRDAVRERMQAVDLIMGEAGASANWTEEQADILGFRLFLRWGGRPEDYINALVRTLARHEPNLPDYTNQLFQAEDIHSVPAPERASARHPSAKWRVYNLVVRELHLRYPKEYKKCVDIY